MRVVHGTDAKRIEIPILGPRQALAWSPKMEMVLFLSFPRVSQIQCDYTFT